MTPPVFTVLSAASTVTALVGSDPVRVFGFGDAPLEPTYPYVTWQTVGGAPAQMLAAVPLVDSHRVQIDCWGATQASVLAVAEAVRDAIEAAGHHMVGFGDTSRDPETKSYRFRMDFQFWKAR